MVKRKSGEKDIIEALAFIKSMRKQAPSENKIVIGFLEEKERALHEELFNTFFGKLNDSKEDS